MFKYSLMTNVDRHQSQFEHQGDRYDLWIPERSIEKRTDDIAKYIAGCYEGQTIRLIQVLRGGKEFGDLLHQRLLTHGEPLGVTVELDTLQAKSYAGTESRELRWISRPKKPIDDETHVVLAEDIADTANTLTAIEDAIRGMGPASLATAVMLDRPEARAENREDYTPHIVGFEIDNPDAWAVGFGLDLDENYRGLPDIYGRIHNGQPLGEYSLPTFPESLEVHDFITVA